jgi:HlyD family secretion protein
MRDRMFRYLRLSGRVGAPILLLVGVVVMASLAFRPGRAAVSLLDTLPRVAVRRADLRLTVTANGRVESAKRTMIVCEIENLQVRSKGQEVSVGGSSTILTLIPDGTIVKQGDVLCRLDSSDYEELVTQQQIKVEEARATYQQADLDYQVKQLAVTEYKEGLVKQLEEDYDGRIALTKADVERSIDRLAWSSRMKSKGYSSIAQLATDKLAVERNQVNLDLLLSEREQFRKYTMPNALRTLEVDVETSRTILEYQTARLKRFEERLKHYEHQVDVCTVRAPHDGFVIYYKNERDQAPLIEEGATVRQMQNLFYLPDLGDMEVFAPINQLVVDRVREGMPARVQIEALPDRLLEGHVIWVSPVPVMNWAVSSDVQSYLGRVKLDSLPNGLRPGMTAQVEIVTANHPDALVVPPAAIAYEGGREVCYVAVQEGVERREVTLGSSTPRMVEVTEGLAEGEEVVLDPVRNNLAAIALPEAPAEPAAGAEVPTAPPAAEDDEPSASPSDNP